MADPRPYVVNANIINLLNSAPIPNLRPSLGSEIQRKTLDIGCYPFPFMVNAENIPLDGRVLSDGTKLPVRTVPFWCSENSYADYYGDPKYNNGVILWQNGRGAIRSKLDPDTPISDSLENAFRYDASLGVTYSTLRINTVFLGLDNTVPISWINAKNSVFGNLATEVTFGIGDTFEVAKNVVFKLWSGLTFQRIEGIDDEDEESIFAFRLMQDYIDGGGTFSPLLDRYNYGCLEQVFNNTNFSVIGITPNEFWEGTGVSYGISGGMTGQFFLLNAVTGGNDAGSYIIFSPRAEINFPYDTLLDGASGGQTLSGRRLATNLFTLGTDTPFIGSDEPPGGFIETMALLLGTSQKIVTLATGGTASLRSLDFNSPCSASFQYDDTSVLGRWGYRVLKVPVGQDAIPPATQVEVGCNVLDFQDYLQGATAQAHGIYHPLSWMFSKGVSSGGEISRYSMAYIHDYVGNSGSEAIFNKLDGLHDYLCYEVLKGNTVESRSYYPLRPITKQWYDATMKVFYTESGWTGYSEAVNFGDVLDKKYYTQFDSIFRDQIPPSGITASLIDYSEISSGVKITIVTDSSVNNIKGVTGILFPYMIPVASFAMDEINDGNQSIVISGEWPGFQGWNAGDGPGDYQYYADGISSSADLESATDTPFYTPPNTPPDFRLFSWNMLERVLPREVVTQEPVKSSFTAKAADKYGVARYNDRTADKTLFVDGSQIDVSPITYLPRSIPDSPQRLVGLTFTYNPPTGSPTTRSLDCGSYVNVARYANIIAPNESGPNDIGVPGLTAISKTIALVSVAGQGIKSLSEFEPDLGLVEEQNSTNSFTRTGSVPNTNSNFYTKNSANNGNFFFIKEEDEPTIGVFGATGYYLTSQEVYANSQNQGSGSAIRWWEDISWPEDFDKSTVSQQIYNALYFASTAPERNLWSLSNWQDLTFGGFGGQGGQPLLTDQSIIALQTRFRQSDYSNTPGWFFFDEDFGINQPLTNPPTGIQQALEEGVHPAFVYRFFTINHSRFFGNIADDVVSQCSQNWEYNGTLCHKLPQLNQFYTDSGGIYQHYKDEAGGEGCGQAGPYEDIERVINNNNIGFDFFGKMTLRKETIDTNGFPLNPFVYAYAGGEFHPSFEGYNYENEGCANTSNQQIPDPPIGATLSAFGITFANALNALRTDKISLDSAARIIRDELFGFTGSTAAPEEDGTGNNVGQIKVSDWLNTKLSKMLDFYNSERSEASKAVDVGYIDSVFSTLYPDAFPVYKQGLDSSITYRLRAIKPQCVEEWSLDCLELANNLLSRNPLPEFRRAGGFGSNDSLIKDDEINAGVGEDVRFSRPKGNRQPQTGSVPPPLTSSDIISNNEGFLSAFKTVYIEPLGLAQDVLATEEQLVPRATISSTVFGKITTVIDSGGFLRDVNVVTFESGFGTKITGNNTTGVISFTVDGLTLGSLVDTNISGLTHNDILFYDSELDKWINRPFSDVISPYLMGLTTDPNFFYQDTPPNTGITLGSRWMNSNTGIEYIYINDGSSDQWVQSSVEAGVDTPSSVYNTTIVTGSEYYAIESDYYIGVSHSSPVTITLPISPEQGKTIVVKDASGFASNAGRNITIVGATAADTIDNEDYVVIATDNGALQFIYKNGWRII
jgi:hypothetical protein